MPVIDLGRVIGPQGPQGAQGAQGQRGEQGFPGPNIVGGDTATTLTGVLVGNGNVVVTRAIDDAPTENSTGFATSGGTKEALDTKANQEQLAPVETGTTASVRHEEGSNFCWNGLLYRTTVTIPANGPITPGANCEPANVAEAIDPLAKVLFAQATDIHTDTTVTLNESAFKYKFLVLALSADSGNSSSNRGSLTIPIATFTGGMHYPVFVGTLGVIRLGLSSGEPNKLRFISTSISSIYLQSVYGIR